MDAPEININPWEYDDVVCNKCGNNVFRGGIIFKKVPGVLLGAGDQKEVPLPMKVTFCSKCGALSPQDQEAYDRALKKKADKANSGNLII
jgi:ribosomal protein S27AE